MWGVLKRLFTTARPRGSQPSSQAISTDLVAQENVELMLVAKAKSPAPTIKATYSPGGKISRATSDKGLRAAGLAPGFSFPRQALKHTARRQLRTTAPHRPNQIHTSHWVAAPLALQTARSPPRV